MRAYHKCKKKDFELILGMVDMLKKKYPFLQIEVGTYITDEHHKEWLRSGKLPDCYK